MKEDKKQKTDKRSKEKIRDEDEHKKKRQEANRKRYARNRKRKLNKKLAGWNKIEHKRHADELENGETSCSLKVLRHYQPIPVD